MLYQGGQLVYFKKLGSIAPVEYKLRFDCRKKISKKKYQRYDRIVFFYVGCRRKLSDLINLIMGHTNKETGSWYVFWRSLRQSFREIKKNDPLRLAGATAFFTTFALPPILIILFQLFSLFLSRRLVGTEMMKTITDTFGKDSAAQLRQTTRGFHTLAINWYITLAGFLFLIFVATTLFSVIKNSLNDIWNIGVENRPGIRFNLQLRARSMGIILVAGLLFLGGIFMDGFEILASNYFQKLWPAGRLFFKSAINEIVSVIIITIWFIVLFR